MRHSKVIVAAGSLRTGASSLRRGLMFAAVTLALAWTGVAFAQEAYVGHRLGQQASDLRQQNAVLAAQNQGYKKDIQSLTSGAANEEEARLNGYARSNERLYLVTSPPSPTPVPPTPKPSPTPH
jgi:cell division protein FtsB